MEATKESVEGFLKTKYNEYSILSDIDECMSEYLNDDWEEEFEDEHSAYIETGNGEAESQVCTQIEKEILKELNITYEQYAEKIGEEVWDTIIGIYKCLDN